MNNQDLLVLAILISLHDGLRKGVLRFLSALVFGLPHFVLFLFKTILNSPWLLMDLFRAIREFFTSPVFTRRTKKFKTLKRGYYSFLVLIGAYVLSFFLPLFMTSAAWMVQYNGSTYFPVVKSFFGYYLAGTFTTVKWDYYGSDFGQPGDSPVNYRELKKTFETEAKGNKVVLAIYPYSPNESNLLEYPDSRPPTKPDEKHWFGTDDRGRDVLARMCYGFQISMTFALIVTFFSYLIGVAVGGYMGYFGGLFDIVVQRFVEIWSAIPFLYTVMIAVSVVGGASMKMLVFLLVIFGWMGMTFYIRGEFLREKAKDYVSAAISIGVKDSTIIFKHILPNALTPVISFMPFAIVGNITGLVSLDFLGFGLPVPTPSWGELMGQGMANLRSPWLVFAPLSGLFATLMLVSFVGEAVREAFDPKQYSRIR